MNEHVVVFNGSKIDLQNGDLIEIRLLGRFKWMTLFSRNRDSETKEFDYSEELVLTLYGIGLHVVTRDSKIVVINGDVDEIDVKKPSGEKVLSYKVTKNGIRLRSLGDSVVFKGGL